MVSLYALGIAIPSQWYVMYIFFLPSFLPILSTCISSSHRILRAWLDSSLTGIPWPIPDIRGHSSRQRIPLLLSLQYHRQSLLIHRSHHLQRHHRRLPYPQQIHSFLLPHCRQHRQFRGVVALCRRGQESKGARSVLGGGEGGKECLGERTPAESYDLSYAFHEIDPRYIVCYHLRR